MQNVKSLCKSSKKYFLWDLIFEEAQMSIIINEIRAISGRKISPQRRMLQREVSNLLNQDINDIVELTKKSSKKQLSFLQTLANNFNRFNFYRNPAEKDNSKLVNEIFSKLKNQTIYTNLYATSFPIHSKV